MAEIVDADTDARRRSGSVALQLHRGPAMKVQFRNIRLKRLPLGDLKKVVYVAGTPSHPPRMHEHNAGAQLAAKLLNENHEPLKTWSVSQAWPKKWSVSDFKAEESTLVIETLELSYRYFKLR